ncbi:hypothetical protein FQN57_004441, partial [Myotisia sp. PD_48]
MATVQMVLVVLNTPADWNDWNETFQKKILNLNLKHEMDGTTQILEPPIMPTITMFARTTTGTRNTSAAPQTFAELTAEQQTIFMNSTKIYEVQDRAYQSQSRRIGELREWIMKTVALHLQRLYCKSDDSVSQWYKKLKAASGSSELENREMALLAYQKALRPPSKKTNLMNWIAEWEKAYHMAVEKGLPSIQSPFFWYREAQAALKDSAIKEFITLYSHDIREKLGDDSLEFADV